ncbi:leukocyte receptor cluster member 1 homolog [Panonychus citri]|uniref:leukocyte receptor cluster member 1 homolog n=1 Tax=Panonychus citri TaxID=50023 RepID=UPI00230799EE|nr:leukocyte receptor cluster member 1 homolog [Panonychus citri]
MNILHHKSWHVRNKNNIAKVRAAEKKAREEEEAKEKRKLTAESEARVNLLRAKARSGNSSTNDDATISTIAAILDGKEPSAVGEDRQNIDHEKEVKKDKEDWEKKVGILTYLGQGCDEDNPWYLLDHNTRMNIKEDDPSTSRSDKPKSLLKHDPLIGIEKHLAAMKKAKEKSSIPPPKVIPFTPMVSTKVKEEVVTPQRKIKKEKKSKRSKHKKHKSRQKRSSKKSRSSPQSESDSSFSDESSSSDDNEEIEKRAKLEALRAERLHREKLERERTNLLLNKSIKLNKVTHSKQLIN